MVGMYKGKTKYIVTNGNKVREAIKKAAHSQKRGVYEFVSTEKLFSFYYGTNNITEDMYNKIIKTLKDNNINVEIEVE